MSGGSDVSTGSRGSWFGGGGDTDSEVASTVRTSDTENKKPTCTVRFATSDLGDVTGEWLTILVVPRGGSSFDKRKKDLVKNLKE